MGDMGVCGGGRHALAFGVRHIEIPRVALVETRGFELQRDHVKPIVFRQPPIGPVQQARGLGRVAVADSCMCSAWFERGARAKRESTRR